MDALAGYGSSDSSGSSNQEVVGNSGISGLIGHYSDDSDDEQNGKATHTHNHILQPGVSEGPGSDVVKKGVGNGETPDVNNGGEEKQEVDGQPKKRRRWDNPNDVDNMTTNNTINIDSLLPAPKLLDSSTDPFQSMTLVDKDHTTELRQKLAHQLQTQTQTQEGKLSSTEKQQQLNKKLVQLYDKFQQNDQPQGSSFAAHLKSSHEFGNPNLIKTVIDHFEINPLASHVGNSFKGFETWID